MATKPETTEKRAAPAGRARKPARRAKGRWSEIVLVCGKCGKRQGLGRAELRKRLKRASKARGGPRLKVAEVGCLGICPGKGVVAATGADLTRGRVLVLPPDVEGAAALDALLAEDGQT